MLADCYTLLSSKPSVPPTSALDFVPRSLLLKTIFNSLTKEQGVDMFLLQEVDHYADFFEPTFDALGYKTVYLQRPERPDGCLIAFDSNKLTLRQVEEVQLDDLVSKGQQYGGGGKQFARSNVCLLAKFAAREQGQEEKVFCVSNCHLYWNPNKPQVKLAQARYAKERMLRFRSNGSISGVMAGDFNALPGTDVYAEMTTMDNSMYTIGSCSVHRNGGQNHRPRFLCDASLSRLCRWLRLLGLNSALETKSQLEKRSKSKDFSTIFEQAQRESRWVEIRIKNLSYNVNKIDQSIVAASFLQDYSDIE